MSRAIITTVRETTWDTSSSATFTDTITLSNLGPLSTTFTPPADCLNTWYVTSFHLELGVQSRTDCFPPGFTPANTKTSGYYSPGLCPSSYTGAESLSLWWTAPGETGVKCCPIGYRLPAEVTASCFTPVSPPMTTSFTDGTVVRTGVFTEIWAPAIPVLWKSLAEFNITSTASGVNPASTKIGPSPGDSVSPAASTTGSTTDSSGIATLHDNSTAPNDTHATTIALATAIPIVLIALAIAAFIILRRRARKIRAATIDTTITGLPELAGNADNVHKPAPVELPAIPAAIELPTKPARPVELPAVDTPRSPPVEQPGTSAADTPPVEQLSTTAAAPAADVIVPLQDDEEMEWLNRELQRVNERRENLRKLEALNDEHSLLQQRINARLGAGAPVADKGRSDGAV